MVYLIEPREATKCQKCTTVIKPMYGIVICPPVKGCPTFEL